MTVSIFTLWGIGGVNNQPELSGLVSDTDNKMKRSRGRGRRQQNPVNRSYDSSGPDVRVRGTASQVYEKYQSLARDAMASGDRVMAENLQQHAEHYYRIIAAYQTPVTEDEQGVEEDGEAASIAAAEAVDADSADAPLVLSRKNAGEENLDGNGAAVNGDGMGDGEEAPAPKSGRRRGPLRRRRGQNGNDADTVEAADNNAGEDLPEAVATGDAVAGDAGSDDAALSASASD